MTNYAQPSASSLSGGGTPAFTAVLERHFRVLAATVLLMMAIAQFAVMRGESQAFDESYHLLSGYTYLKTGILPLSGEHPPLAQLIASLPLLPMKLRLPGNHLEAGDDRQFTREREFLYANRYPAETILMAARSADVVMTLLLGLVMAWWTRRHFGAVPALVALLVLAFDPTFLAHGHYTNTDVPAALCFLAGALSWNTFLSTGRLSRAMVCGGLTGVAMSTKYSALLLFPTYLLLYMVHWWQQSGSPGGSSYRCSMGHLTKSMLVLVAVMFLVVFGIFSFEARPLIPTEMMLNPEPLSAKILRRPELLGRLAPWVLTHPDKLRMVEVVLQHAPVPAASFFRGLYLVTQHATGGTPAYLLGRYSTTGWWYYFPVVMAVKSPVGLLLLFLLAAVVSARALFREGLHRAVSRLRNFNLDWYVLLVPPLFYFAVSVRSHINIGIRHVLPMYPFLFIWIAAVLFSQSRQRVPLILRRFAVACLILVVVESILAFPNYLGFFNTPSGGLRMGPRYAVDSNLDWGQDLIHLKQYLSSHNISNVCLAHFGPAPPSYFGIIATEVPSSFEGARQTGCVIVMSNTRFAADGGAERQYQWLKNLLPTDYVGTSFRVYDLDRATPTR